VNILPPKVKLPFAIFLGSLIFISLLVMLTNPLNNIIFVSLFFLLAYILLNSVGFLALSLQKKEINNRLRTRLVLSSTFILILLMFRSAKALSLLDGLLLVFFSAGIFFYLSRR
jgi:hypothetical protein